MTGIEGIERFMTRCSRVRRGRTHPPNPNVLLYKARRDAAAEYELLYNLVTLRSFCVRPS
jgi:hypothetical protein